MNKFQELLQVLEKEHQITCKATNIEETLANCEVVG